MKKSLFSAISFSAALMLTGQAQEPGLSGTASDLLFPSVNPLFPSIPAPAPKPTPEPEASSPAPEAGKPGSAATTPEAAATPSMDKGTAAQLRLAVRMRQIKTDLLGDAAIQGELTRARCAKTEEGRRVLMRNYYTLLYTRIERIDPALFELAEQELYAALLQYEQHNVKPTALIEPGISPLPKSCAADHAPGKCPAPATPSPSPEASPAAFASPTPVPLP